MCLYNTVFALTLIISVFCCQHRPMLSLTQASLPFHRIICHGLTVMNSQWAHDSVLASGAWLGLFTNHCRSYCFDLWNRITAYLVSMAEESYKYRQRDERRWTKLQNSRRSGSYSAGLLKEEEKRKKEETRSNLKKRKLKQTVNGEMYMYWNTFL